MFVGQRQAVSPPRPTNQTGLRGRQLGCWNWAARRRVARCCAGRAARPTVQGSVLLTEGPCLDRHDYKCMWALLVTVGNGRAGSLGRDLYAKRRLPKAVFQPARGQAGGGCTFVPICSRLHFWGATSHLARAASSYQAWLWWLGLVLCWM